jgi:two-component system sensor histidine kinase KdpD
VAAPASQHSTPRALPHPAAGLSPRRRFAGLAIAIVGLPVLTLVLERSSSSFALGSLLLLYLLAVVIIAAVGGGWPGVLAAVASVLAANWFFTPPYRTLIVEGRDSVVELVVFGVVALIVSITVDYAARDRARAARSRMEADLISDLATRPLDDLSLPEILERVRSTFQMSSASLVRTGRTGGRSVVAAVGPVPEEEASIRVAASGELELLAHGPELFAEDRALLGRLATAAARAWEGQHLAAHADRLTEADRVRSALLASVGHDLRTPLSGLKAAISGLRQVDVAWSDEEREELLATIEDSTDRLSGLIADILDLTRIQVGSVIVRPANVAVDEITSLALLDLPTHAVRMDIPDTLPLVSADSGLLERVIANLVDNAVRHSPPNRPAEIRAAVVGEGVRLSVVDHGPGVPNDLWPAMFAPFQRLGDRATGAGAGLGLAIVQGFCLAMDIPVEPADTPGGGLTMTLTLPLAGP